eukprot:3545497-Pleurochrysis_carterae.AAC.1
MAALRPAPSVTANTALCATITTISAGATDASAATVSAATASSLTWIYYHELRDRRSTRA